MKFSMTGQEWVSEWLLFNTNSAIFQLYHGETGQENGDLLIQVTAWAGLTESKYLIKIILTVQKY